jgi:hypothetical protein
MTRTRTPEGPIRVCFSDPPYLGESKRLYGDHPEAAVYDTLEGHAALIARLTAEFPDGWALSLHTPSLRHVLPLCPEDCRVGAWVKPFCSWKPNAYPAYAWEPVVWRGGRKPGKWQLGDRQTARDWVAESITLRRSCKGAKPDGFCFWLFALLGLRPGDELVDLFPGSGAVSRAWERWQRMEAGMWGATP